MTHLQLVHTFTAVISGLVMSTSTLAATYDFRPSANTFVTTAGSGSVYPNIANHNFGGGGSLGLAAANWIGSGQTAPRGYAEIVLAFDLPAISEPTLTSLSLDLTITKDMSTGGKNVFNKTGSGGYFDIFLLPTTFVWEQGYDSPETANSSSTFGITYNTLHADADYDHKILLSSVYYNYASTTSGITQTFDLSDALSNTSFSSILTSGNTFTLLLAPHATDTTTFNIATYIQNNGSSDAAQEPNLKATGPMLHLSAVPEPTSLSLGIVGLLLLGCRTYKREM